MTQVGVGEGHYLQDIQEGQQQQRQALPCDYPLVLAQIATILVMANQQLTTVGGIDNTGLAAFEDDRASRERGVTVMMPEHDQSAAQSVLQVIRP